MLCTFICIFIYFSALTMTQTQIVGLSLQLCFNLLLFLSSLFLFDDSNSNYEFQTSAWWHFVALKWLFINVHDSCTFKGKQENAWLCFCLIYFYLLWFYPLCFFTLTTQTQNTSCRLLLQDTIIALNCLFMCVHDSCTTINENRKMCGIVLNLFSSVLFCF